MGFQLLRFVEADQDRGDREALPPERAQGDRRFRPARAAGWRSRSRRAGCAGPSPGPGARSRSPSVSSSRASASRIFWNWSNPRRVSTTTGRRRSFSSLSSKRSRASSRVAYPSFACAIGLERLLADAVGGVAAVAGQAELLVQHRHRVGDARGGGDGQVGAVRLAARRVAVRVEVDEDRRPGEARRLVDAAVQTPVRAVTFQWTRWSGSPTWYSRTPAVRVGSSNSRFCSRTSPMGRSEAKSYFGSGTTSG